MSAYDLEEQEQLAELKAFWKQYSNLIVVAACAALVALAGYRTWNWYQGKQAVQASAIYAELQKAGAANDTRKVREEAGKLIEQYPRSLYAALGGLISAKAHFESGDAKTARAQLQWVIDQTSDPGVQAIARLRLANVMLDERAYEDALQVLAAKRPASFEPLFEALRGDVLVAQGKDADARTAYQAALAKFQSQDEAERELIQMKLDSVRGR